MIRFSPYHGLIMVVLLLLFVGFWVGVALIVRALIRGGTPAAPVAPAAPAVTSTPPTTRPAALQILDERLARGEIDPVEYAERRRLLEGGGAG